MGDVSEVLVSPFYIIVSWDDLITADNGGDIPDFYLLQYFTNETNVWINLTDPVAFVKVLEFNHT